MRLWALVMLAACGGGDKLHGDTAADGAEICDNGIDDDGDLRTDCRDDDCADACTEVCDDGADNDGDGLADCADDDCAGACPEICDNGVDDDADGAADCADPDCDGGCLEACTDGRDNDGDGAIDCDDPDCFGAACAEVCDDGLDNDGDGAIDCDDADCSGGCPEDCANGLDDDGDGLTDCRDDECADTCDADGDGEDGEAYGGRDCDDTDPEVNPDADEVCNGIDDDCDGLADDDDPDVVDPSGLWADDDGDGFGRGDPTGAACEVPDGFAGMGGDCDDGDPDTNPAALEVCGGGDDDCDDLVDDLDPDVDPTTFLTWYPDADGDGFGVPDGAVEACAAPPGYVGNADDCDDTDPGITVDPTWRIDRDADGVGAGEESDPSCDPPGRDWVPAHRGIDCDDADPARYPGAEEICGDGIDQDCDGEDVRLWYPDDDGDGFGAPDDPVPLCEPDGPPGYVADGTDCDDADPERYPDAPERCNGLDDNCDDVVPPDEVDGDGDGVPFCADPDDEDPDVGGAKCWVFDGAGYVSYERSIPGYPLVTFTGETTLIEDDLTNVAALIDFADPLEPPYQITLEFSVWDDDGSDFALYNSADGIAVQLFKDTSVYAREPVPDGGSRGVIDEGTGVVVHLQTYDVRQAWIADGAGTMLASDPWPEVYTHGEWMPLSIEVTDEGLRATAPGMSVAIPGPIDTSFATFAISAATGGSDSEHKIRDVCMERL